ncbi:hypothetical protein Dimus_012219 [Dionaea muscipula]
MAWPSNARQDSGSPGIEYNINEKLVIGHVNNIKGNVGKEELSGVGGTNLKSFYQANAIILSSTGGKLQTVSSTHLMHVCSAKVIKIATNSLHKPYPALGRTIMQFSQLTISSISLIAHLNICFWMFYETPATRTHKGICTYLS